MQRKTTFIYALIDPRDNQVRYVGKSNKPKTRLSGHLKCHTQKTSAKDKWIDELRAERLKPKLIILEEIPVEEWETAEQFWIARYKLAGNSLTNATKGGKASFNSR